VKITELLMQWLLQIIYNTINNDFFPQMLVLICLKHIYISLSVKKLKRWLFIAFWPLSQVKSISV